MAGTLGLVIVFVVAGLLLIRFRDAISRFQTGMNRSAFPFLPTLFTTVTPGGVILTALVFFFLALLGLVATILGAA